jgi:hypothetical protein
MSDLKQWDFPKKVQGGYRVSLLFRTMNGALDFLRGMGAIGDNSAAKALDDWRNSEIKKLDSEARSLKKKVIAWLRRS